MSKYSKKTNLGQMPIIDGTSVTFRFVGDQAPILSGDFNNWEVAKSIQLQQTSPGMWETKLEFPTDTYMEYSYIINGNRILDPLNPQRVNNGTGNLNNYFHMPNWIETTRVRQKPRKGHLTEHLIVDRFRLTNTWRKVIPVINQMLLLPAR